LPPGRAKLSTKPAPWPSAGLQFEHLADEMSRRSETAGENVSLSGWLLSRVTSSKTELAGTAGLVTRTL
jgi:hypothetical protein